MATEFCPQCGAPRVGAFRYCPSCQLDFDSMSKTPMAGPPVTSPMAPAGAAVPPRPESFTTKYGPSGPPPEPVGTARRSGPPWGVIILVALVLLVVGGGVLVWYARNQVNQILSEVGQSVTLSTPSVGPTPTEAPVSGVSSSCAAELGPLADALMELDSRLSVGMSFNDYSDKVAGARVAYDRIRISSLDTACIEGVGASAEAAFNNYIYAYRIWNACVAKLECTMDSIEPKLQDYWAKATVQIDRFRDEMR